MQQRLISVLFVLIVLFFCTPLVSTALPFEITDQEGKALKGPIKSLVVEEEKKRLIPDAKDLSDDKNWQYQRVITHIINYDEKGRRLSSIIDIQFPGREYGNFGLSYEVNEYLPEGKRKEISRGYDSNGIFVHKTIRLFDAENAIIEMAFYDKLGELTWREVYHFTPEGGQSGSTTYDEKGSITLRTIHSSSNVFDFIETRVSPDMKRLGSTGYKVDSSGNTLENVSFDKDQKQFSRTTYKYNEKGLKIQSKNFWGDHLSPKEITNYDYDLHGNLIRKARSNYPKFDIHWEKECADRSNLPSNLQWYSCKERHKVTLYKYLFDEWGNWVKRIEREEVSIYPITITYRQITYYHESQENSNKEKPERLWILWGSMLLGGKIQVLATGTWASKVECESEQKRRYAIKKESDSVHFHCLPENVDPKGAS